ncbi:MAG TPA: hypothetical protein VFB54_04195, partial [Burkholderiales bacterium]|nr:hypothetical protein [Burkholderiales bacterium]
QDDRHVRAARMAAQAVATTQREDGWIAGTLDEQWQSSVGYACVTGIAQMALCWLRLAQEGEADALREHARLAIAYVQRTQRLADKDPAVRGAIPGSVPIWGAYSRFEFPNWGAKFFADASMMQMKDKPVPPVAMRTEPQGDALAPA